MIEAEGYTYDVSASLGQEKYPERSYEDFVLPAGSYTSLRIIIGEGAGHNWWCVVYPPLCFTSGENVKYRSKIAEIIADWKKKKG